MNIVFMFFGLQAVCLCSAFGVAYTFLKNTPYRHLSLLLAPALFPACLVLMETLCGHSIPNSLPYAVPLLITLALLLYSGIVAWREWGALVSIRRDLMKNSGMLLAATLLGMTSLAADIAHGSLTYLDFQLNNELLNYAALAGHLMGRTINQGYAADYGHSIMSRSGADLLLASVAHAAGAPPANCIYLLVALLRSHAIAAFALLLFRATRGGIAKRPVVLYSGLALFGLCSLQLLNYASSYLSQYSVAPLLILSAAFLIQEEDVTNLRVLGLLTLLYVCIYIAYPEIVPLLIFIQGGQALLLALRGRSVRLFWMALAPFAAAFVVNPALAISRIRFLVDLAGVHAGFVMFAPASDNPAAYAATIFGLRFPYLGLKAFNERWTEAAIVTALLLYAAAALYLAFRRGRQNWALSIAVLLIVCTAVTWISHASKDGPTAIYKAEKAIMYGHFLFLAALVLAVAEPPRKQVWRRLFITAYVVILIANFRLSAEVIGRSASWRTVYPLNDLTRAVEIFRRGMPVALPAGNGISSMYWNGVLQYFGIKRRYIDALTRAQCGTVFDAVDPPDTPPASPHERGAVIADSFRTVVNADGLSTLPTDSRQVNMLFRAPSFVVYEGLLSDTVEHFSARIRVRTHQLGSVKLPLLTTGQEFKGSILYLNKLSLGHYRVELDVWYTAHKNGDDLTAAADPSDEDEILVEGQGSGIVYTVNVSVNGHAALQYHGMFGGVSARTLFWARNAISFPEVTPACEICTVGQAEINHEVQQ